MPSVHKREAAARDLVDHFIYLAENAGLGVADRFHVRKWRVKGFDNHLIFYEPLPDGVSIVRVLHAASGWWRLLGLE